MIIAAAGDCLFAPHRHPGKSELFHMIEGRLAVILFFDGGEPRQSLLLSAPGQGTSICYRLATPAFHTILPLDDVVVFHEITNGPFRAGDAEIADWAPPEPEPLRRFIQDAAIAGGLSRDMVLRSAALA